MCFPITVKSCRNSLLLACIVVLLGCNRGRDSAGEPLFLYCTPSAKPFALVLQQRATAALQREVILAPLRAKDLTTALASTRAGDVVICLGESLPKTLSEHKLLAKSTVIGYVAPCLAASRYLTLQEAAAGGMRLGFGKADGPLGRTALQGIPTDLKDGVTANITQRSEKTAELSRLLRLGALDATFTWDSPALSAEVKTTPLHATCPLLAIELSCSRKSPDLLRSLWETWLGEDTGKVLANLGVHHSPRKADDGS